MEELSFLEAYKKERWRIENAMKAIGYKVREIDFDWYAENGNSRNRVPAFVIHTLPVNEQYNQ